MFVLVCVYDYMRTSVPKTDLCQSRSHAAEQLFLQNNFGLKPLSRACEANHILRTGSDLLAAAEQFSKVCLRDFSENVYMCMFVCLGVSL